jgi:hypothetical protein
MASSLCCFPRNRGIRNLREYSNARAALRDREAGSTFDQTIEDSVWFRTEFPGGQYTSFPFLAFCQPPFLRCRAVPSRLSEQIESST